MSPSPPKYLDENLNPISEASQRTAELPKYLDENLNPIKEKPFSVKVANAIRDFNPEVFPEPFRRITGLHFKLPLNTRALSEALPSIGGMAGAAIAAPESYGVGALPGYVAGATAGSAAKEQLRSSFPNLFGQANEESPLSQTAGDVVGNAAFDIPFMGLSKLLAPTILPKKLTAGSIPTAREVITSKFLKKFYPSNLTPEEVAAVKQTNLPLSVGQASDAQGVESVLVPRQKEALIGQQQAQLGTEAGNIVAGLEGKPAPAFPQVRGEEAVQAAKNLRSQFSKQEAAAFGKVNLDAAANTAYYYRPTKLTKNGIIRVDYQPISQADFNALPASEKQFAEAVQGPIFTIQGKTLFNKVNKELADAYSTIAPVDPIVGKQIAVLQNRLAGFEGKPVKPFAEVKDLRTEIGNLTDNLVTYKREHHLLDELRNALGKDIDESVSKYWLKTPNAKANLDAANAVTRERAGVFTKDIRKSLVEAAPVEKGGRPSEFLDKAFRSPEDAERVAIATGVAERTPQGYRVLDKKNPLAAQWFDNLRMEYTNPGTKEGESLINGTGMLKKFQTAMENGTLQKFTTADQRQQIKYFINRANVVSPTRSQIGKYALAFQEAGIAANAPPSVIDAVTGGTMGPLLRTATRASIIIGGKKFARDVLLNPKYARIAADLVAMPVESEKSKLLTRSLFGALKGAELQLITEQPDGSETKNNVTIP